MSNFELNNIAIDSNSNTVTQNSPVVKIFSALVAGNDTKLNSELNNRKDKSIDYIKELGRKATLNDGISISELNAIQKYAIKPELIKELKLFNGLGTFKSIGYNETPIVTTYEHVGIDPRFQASSGDVTMATQKVYNYPINTKVVAAGYAVDYREFQAGNFDGTIAEGLEQTRVSLRNQSVKYALGILYNAIKNANGVKNFNETAGITKASLDAMLGKIRRHGKPGIAGDYSVISQLASMAGFVSAGSTTVGGADVLFNELRQNGIINFYLDSPVVEIPNAVDFNTIVDKKGNKEFGLTLPEGLLFIIPRGTISPLQTFQRGDMTTMTGDDIVTRQRLTRFDLEIAADVAKGQEYKIGLISDTNFTAPELIG